MGFSYSKDPTNNHIDRIRLTIGDTNEAYAMLDDSEIEYFYQEADENVLLASIKACEAIRAKLAYDVDYTLGPESVKASQRFEHINSLLAQLKKQYAATLPSALPSMAKPAASVFGIGMHDNG